MKISQEQINYIEYLCKMLPKTLRAINEEYSKDDFIYSSSNRASFDRLRIELTKTLIKIKKEIYR